MEKPQYSKRVWFLVLIGVAVCSVFLWQTHVHEPDAFGTVLGILLTLVIPLAITSVQQARRIEYLEFILSGNSPESRKWLRRMKIVQDDIDKAAVKNAAESVSVLLAN